jgi:predicted nucleotidyltransferase
MIPPELKGEVEEFVSRIKMLPGLEHVIVYGSVARGKYTDDSDIDVLVLFADKKSEKKNAPKVKNAAAEIKGKLPILPSIYSRKTLKKGDPDFFRGVFREGVIVFSSGMREIPIREALSAKPFCIFTYFVEHLDATGKSRLSHALLGRTTKAGGKRYTYGGLLEKLGGRFLGRGAVIVEQPHAEELRDFFNEHGVKYEEYLVWVDKEFAKKL